MPPDIVGTGLDLLGLFGGGPGGGQAAKPTAPPSVQKIADEAQCEKLARDRANNRFAEIAIHNISKPAKQAFYVMVSGAAFGCLAAFETGCGEGAIAGAAAGIFGGFFEGAAQAIYGDISGTINNFTIIYLTKGRRFCKILDYGRLLLFFTR